MMTIVFRSCRIVPLLSFAALLAGCAALPPPPPAQPKSITPAITPADLKRATDEAYEDGFVAGRHYQRKHDGVGANGLPDLSKPNGGLPVAPAQGAAGCSPPSGPPQPPEAEEPPAPIPPLPPSSNYTTSGPAKPLSQ